MPEYIQVLVGMYVKLLTKNPTIASINQLPITPSYHTTPIRMVTTEKASH